MDAREWLLWLAGVVVIIAVCAIAVGVICRRQPSADEQADLERDGWCFDYHGYGTGVRGMQMMVPHRHPDVRPADHVIKPPRQGSRPYRLERDD